MFGGFFFVLVDRGKKYKYKSWKKKSKLKCNDETKELSWIIKMKKTKKNNSMGGTIN
jgi:hypothetical protein